MLDITTTRLENESYTAFLKRIVRMCADKQIAYTEMGDALLGSQNVYSDDNLRKAFYVLDKIVDNLDGDCNITSNDVIREIELQKDELKKERYKLQATKIEDTRNKRQVARFELFYENIRDAIKVLPIPEFKYKSDIDNNKKCIVVGIGDVHYGATFSSENNSYSRDECKNRFNKLLNYLIDYVKKNNLDTIKIVNVADCIQGILRLSDLQINDTAVVQCVVEISQIIANFLNQLSSVCKVEYYHITSANHSQTRNLGSQASVLAEEDVEKIIANYIHDMLIDNSNVDVIFDTNKEYIDFKVFDFQCTAEHGHRVKNIETFIKDKISLRRKMYSYAFLGHTHSSKEIIVGEEKNNNIEILVVPSFIGSDPYSDTLNVGSKAMAKLYEFDEVYGHIGSKNIILN